MSAELELLVSARLRSLRILHGFLSAEAMDVPRADFYQPGLRIGNPVAETVAGCHFFRVEFKGTRLNVDRNEFPLVAGLEGGANLAFVNRVAALGDFLFAVTGASFGHSLLQTTFDGGGQIDGIVSSR